jgi:hypothetical protein
MAINTDYQSVVTLGRLYRIGMVEGGRGLGQALAPRIMAKGGTMDIYFADATVDPTSLAEMALVKQDTTGQAIESIADYMAIVENQATVNEVIITGVELKEDLGAIS